MDLLVLRWDDSRVEFKTIDEGPDTVLICCSKTLTMLRLGKPTHGNMYWLQMTKHAYGALVVYKCHCHQCPCRTQDLDSLEDRQLFMPFQWADIESGAIPFSTLPDVFLIYMM